MKRSRLCLLVALPTLAAAAQAQDSFQLTIDQGASAWTWSGTTSIGTIIGVPDQNFSLTGTVEMNISGNASRAISDARFLSSQAAVMPNPLVGYIPNPIPGFPNLADIEIHDLVTSISSASFAVAPDGSFTTDITTTVVQGTLIVDPLGGAQTTTDLTGSVGPPNTVGGTLDLVAGFIELNSPQSATFPFTDQASGISGTFTITGTLAADFDCDTATNYCTTSVNSTGSGAVMGHMGSTSLFANDLVLTAGPVPQQPGLFFYGPQSANLPFGNGTRCVGGQLVRLPVIVASGGSFSYAVDYANLPPAGAISSGVTKYFQAWFRDPAGGGAAYNLSDGLSIQFCP